MSKESILARVGVDIATGDLGKARDRLHTLVFEHPDDLSLRERLAEVYDRLQQPAQAGRYWYLVEPRDDRIANARAAYERLVGKDPLLLLAGLKFRGYDDALVGFASQTISELRDRIRAIYGEHPPRSVQVRWSLRNRRRMLYSALQPGRSAHAFGWRGPRPDWVLAAIGALLFLLARALRLKWRYGRRRI